MKRQGNENSGVLVTFVPVQRRNSSDFVDDSLRVRNGVQARTRGTLICALISFLTLELDLRTLSAANSINFFSRFRKWQIDNGIRQRRKQIRNSGLSILFFPSTPCSHLNHCS